MTQISKPELSIRLFSGLEVRTSGLPIAHKLSRKAGWLLALLALAGGRSVSRDALAQTLWPFPDFSEDLASYYLRRRLTGLRAALGSQAFRLTSVAPRSLSLDLNGAFVDVVDFDKSIEAGDPSAVEAVLGLYTGPLLAGCTEAWAEIERERRAQSFQKAVRAVAGGACRMGDYDTAVFWLKRAVVEDPLSEATHRDLMDSLHKRGSDSEALAVYHALRDRLMRERGARPEAQTDALFKRIRDLGVGIDRTPSETQGNHAAVPLIGSSGAATKQATMPAPVSSLIGREADIRAVRELVAEHRLLTLTGAGGVGKTRLAIAAASGVTGDFAGGVWFVDLAPLSDSELVAPLLLTTVRAPEVRDQTVLEALQDHLGERYALIILDNCEHVLGACAQVATALLQRCANLRIVATSRQPLGITGEMAWRVPSLSLPAAIIAGKNESLHLANDSEAVALFVERARLGSVAFELTTQNANQVARICEQLDGIPLAIELAAARLRTMPLEQVCERLSNRFALLTQGSRSALKRHQTLRGLIDWSYDLLTETEGIVLGRLSVFAGGWTLASAEAVCSGDDVGPEEALHALTELVDKSLVTYDEEAGRYRFLETVRQYAHERLIARTEQELTQDKHGRYFLAWIEQGNWRQMREPSFRMSWEAQVRQEHDNIRAAIGRSATDAPQTDLELRFVAAMGPFWRWNGFQDEARRRLLGALERGPIKPSLARATVLREAGLVRDSRRSSIEFFEEALSMSLQVGDDFAIGSSMQNLGNNLGSDEDTRRKPLMADSLPYLKRSGILSEYAWAILNLRRAEYQLDDKDVDPEALVVEPLAIFRDLEDLQGVASVYSNLADLYGWLGAPERKRELYEKVFDCYEKIGFETGMVTVSTRLALMALGEKDADAVRAQVQRGLRALKDREGMVGLDTLHTCANCLRLIADHDGACQLYSECRTEAAKTGSRNFYVLSMRGLGLVALAQGDPDRARPLLLEHFTYATDRQHKNGLYIGLTDFAWVAASKARPHRAATLLGAADAHRPYRVSEMGSIHKADYSRIMEDAHRGISESEFESKFGAGEKMTIAAAVAYALEQSDDAGSY